MIFDIDYLKSLGKFVVHCETKEQANELFQLVSYYLPEKLLGWNPEYTHWDWYEAETCYALHVGLEKRSMQFSPIKHWMEYGYKIIPFNEIFQPDDLGEISKEVCFDTDLLYEIGV